ncbi:hypothetical protein ACFSTE_15755 [Aquimarina hainanensis]|uniref:Uncharacterized protein n=1 Tax=Aquimarina hainanensis TaxID=1578017 RepID=A0ABW5NCH4_9FLAO
MSKRKVVHISKQNSIRFAERIDWGVCGNYKTENNTLSHEENVYLPYTEIQQFQTCDSPITQIKTNYKNQEAFIVDRNGDETRLIVDQITSNQEIKDARDGILTGINQRAAIYFTSGKTYDYDTGVEKGVFDLNGKLPPYAIIGNYVSFFYVEQRYLPIIDIVYSDRDKAYAMVFDLFHLDPEETQKIKCIYDRLDYEVFEFTTNMAPYTNQEIRVKIELSDPEFGARTFLSELISVKNYQENTFELRAKSSTNNDMYYYSGIENKIRPSVRQKSAKVLDTQELHKTDTSSLLLDSEVYELIYLALEPVTTGMMRKIVQLLSLDEVFIDGVPCVKNESIDVSEVLGETNLYIIKATMLISRNTTQSVPSGSDFFGDLSEVPSLIDSDEGFIKQ